MMMETVVQAPHSHLVHVSASAIRANRDPYPDDRRAADISCPASCPTSAMDGDRQGRQGRQGRLSEWTLRKNKPKMSTVAAQAAEEAAPWPG